MSQKDDGDNKEKVEELTEDKSGEINVISAASLTVLCHATIMFILIVNILREKTNQLELFFIGILYISEIMEKLYKELIN